jgi:hypothetical protein
VVEERERDRKRQQHEQVEVQQREGPAPVDERQQKQETEGQPDVKRVYVPPERAGIAARHRPGDLEAGPLFEHPPGEVVDDDLPDLLPAVLGEVADLPVKRHL